MFLREVVHTPGKPANSPLARQPVKGDIDRLAAADLQEIRTPGMPAATELGLRTVGIYSWEDRYCLHRFKADESYQIGGPDAPVKNYLNIPEIIRIATERGVEFIHPGYGFLSENADFAA